MKLKLLFIIFITIIIACSPTRQDENKKLSIEEISDTLKFNEAFVYLLPSPFQVASVVKLLNINYIDELTTKKYQQEFYSSKITNALNLGINIIDLCYLTINEQFQPTLLYLEKIEKQMLELGLKSPQDKNFIENIGNNWQNKDSLYRIIGSFQEKFDEYFKVTEEKKISFLIFAGFYIEGLYIATEIYQKEHSNFMLNLFFEKAMNILVLQQQGFLSNLIELLESYNDPNLERLITWFELLNKDFANLHITYKFNNTQNRIEDIKLKTHNIAKLRSNIVQVRNEIFNEDIIKL